MLFSFWLQLQREVNDIQEQLETVEACGDYYKVNQKDEVLSFVNYEIL